MIFNLIYEIKLFYATNDVRVYPNAILITKEQLVETFPFLKEDVKELLGLKVILTENISRPRLVLL
jgi:hypothetical protein